jgi:orotate phosphoribosyltransferase
VSDLSPPPAGTEEAQQEATGWMSSLAALPRFILQPFSLSAVAVVGAILLGVSGALWPAIGALVAAVLLLIVGLRATPREAVGSLVGGPTYQQVSHISVSTPVDNAGLMQNRGGHLGALEAVCFLHLYLREGGSVGRTRTFQVDYFVDLMTAALVPNHLECLEKELVEHIRRFGRLDGVTTAAGPKRGNSLLLVAAARKLMLEPLFVKERPLFGKTVEGIGGRPKRAVVVDDISSDGELLVNTVIVLRDCGYEVTDAFVLIDRPEGDTREALAQIGVALHPLCTLSDQDLEAIAAKGRRGAGV